MSQTPRRTVTPPRSGGGAQARSSFHNHSDELTRLYELEVEIALQRKDMFNEDLQRRKQAAMDRDDEERARIREHHQRLMAIKSEARSKSTPREHHSQSPSTGRSMPNPTEDHHIAMRYMRPSAATDAAAKAERVVQLHKSLKEWSKASEERVGRSVGEHEAVIGSAEVPIFVHTSESRPHTPTPKVADPLDAYSQGFLEYQSRRGVSPPQPVASREDASPEARYTAPRRREEAIILSSLSETERSLSRKLDRPPDRAASAKQTTRVDPYRDQLDKDLTSTYLTQTANEGQGTPKEGQGRRSQRRHITPPREALEKGYSYPPTVASGTSQSPTTNGQYGAGSGVQPPPDRTQARAPAATYKSPNASAPIAQPRSVAAALKASIGNAMQIHSMACAEAAADFKALYGSKAKSLPQPSSSGASDVAAELIGLVMTWSAEPLERQHNPQQCAKYLETLRQLVAFATNAWLKLELAPTADNLPIAEAVRVRATAVSQSTISMVTPLCFQLLGILSKAQQDAVADAIQKGAKYVFSLSATDVCPAIRLVEGSQGTEGSNRPLRAAGTAALMNRPFFKQRVVSDLTIQKRMASLVHMKAEEFQRMRDEMKLVRRKFKFIQGVSTVFRQKIAFILRDLSTAHIHMEGGAIEAYGQAVRDLGTIGYELSASVLGGSEVPVTSAGDNKHDMPSSVEALSFKELLDRMEVIQEQIARQQGAPKSLEDRASEWASNKQSREDVRKAHHLCMLLDDKNVAMELAATAEERLKHIHSQFTALSEKYQRLVQLLQQRGPDHNASVERELYEQRIAALEDALTTARRDRAAGEGGLIEQQGATERGLIGAMGDPTVAAAGILSLTNSSDVKVLQKQNNVLRARVQSLRQEVETLQARGKGSIEELQEGMDGLFGRVRSLQLDLADRNSEIQRLTNEGAESNSVVSQAKQQVAMYIDQLAHINAEHQALASSYAELKSCSTVEAKELGVVVSEYTDMVAHRDNFIKQLQYQLMAEQRAAREREVNISVLGAQIESYRSRVDVMAAAEEAKRLQTTSIAEMGHRMTSTLEGMQALYTNGSISGQIEAIGGKMADLEGMEVQVRLKDDQIAVLHDECDRLRASHAELTASLNSVTALFSSMPKSGSELEALVVELEESRAELARCAQQNRPPDTNRLGQQIDLRLLEARHRKKSALVAQGQHTQGSMLHTSDMADDDAFTSVNASLLSVPPPPTLVNITDSIFNNRTTHAFASAAASSPHAANHRQQDRVQPAHLKGTAPVAKARQPLPPRPSSEVEDIHTTFDLFSEPSESGEMVMVGDGIQMAYSTLGVEGPGQSKINMGPMNRETFVAHCAKVIGIN